jgi:hypothetical protein
VGVLDCLTYAVWVLFFSGSGVACLHWEHVHISRFTHIYSIRWNVLFCSVLFCSVLLNLDVAAHVVHRTRPVFQVSLKASIR